MRALDALRGLAYRLGFRPRPGSVLHSPSRDWRYAFKDADVAGAMLEALRKAQGPRP